MSVRWLVLALAWAGSGCSCFDAAYDAYCLDAGSCGGGGGKGGGAPGSGGGGGGSGPQYDLSLSVAAELPVGECAPVEVKVLSQGSPVQAPAGAMVQLAATGLTVYGDPACTSVSTSLSVEGTGPFRRYVRPPRFGDLMISAAAVSFSARPAATPVKATAYVRLSPVSFRSEGVCGTLHGTAKLETVTATGAPALAAAESFANVKVYGSLGALTVGTSCTEQSPTETTVQIVADTSTSSIYVASLDAGQYALLRVETAVGDALSPLDGGDYAYVGSQCEPPHGGTCTVGTPGACCAGLECDGGAPGSAGRCCFGQGHNCLDGADCCTGVCNASQVCQ